MARKINEIEGIGEAYARKLAESGITDTGLLLDRGAAPGGRREIEQRTGISGSLILRWVNHADLFRIQGIAGQYSELLEAAGVDTVPELAMRRPEALCSKLAEVNRARNLVRSLPSQSEVQDWIEQASRLPRLVTH